jgi:hypothetical protein
MKKKNELNACNALIEILERITGVRYECENSPDDGSSDGPEVDFILKSTCDGTLRIAVEHTVIELFEGQIGYVRWSHDIVEEINNQCRGKIPPDRYFFLRVPEMLITTLRSKKRKMAFVDSVAPWIAQHAWKLKVGEFLSRSYEYHEVTVTCEGTNPSLNGKLGRMPEQPTDLKTLQKDRFDIAIQHALKKFWKYKLKRVTTVLLLEDIAGFKYEQVRKQLTFFEKVWIYLFVNYIVVLASNNDKMIGGNVWKENYTWYSFIPCDRRFDLHSPP